MISTKRRPILYNRRARTRLPAAPEEYFSIKPLMGSWHWCEAVRPCYLLSASMQ